MLFMRDHKNVFGWANGQKAIIGRLKKRFSCSDYIQKLFWLGISAIGPKSGSNSTCHQHHKKISIHSKMAFIDFKPLK
jgi:hypothetical protein